MKFRPGALIGAARERVSPIEQRATTKESENNGRAASGRKCARSRPLVALFGRADSTRFVVGCERDDEPREM